jgi:multicomponent Na+:H+ antiporter subunit D
MLEWAHPGAPYLAGAALLPFTPRALRPILLLAAPASGLVLAWSLADGAEPVAAFFGQPLILLKVDRLARLFSIIFALVGGLGALYALGQTRSRLHTPAFVAAAAAQGVVLAGDWLTLYVCWEALALASFVLVDDGASPRSANAAFRYLLVHLAGGAFLLAGLVWLGTAGAGLVVRPLGLEGAGALIFLAFAVNAAIPPLHAWLTDAYPEASAGASVYLSAFTTKAAVYALARVFAGHDLLILLGVTMALYGVVFAVLENNIRRLLAYHIVSQVGYMVTAVGLGTPLALSGAAAHAFCHILYKALLFMGAGAVVEVTGRGKLTELGGLGARLPLTCALYMIGALAISGAPLLNGFISKSLVVAAAEEEHRWLVAGLLTLASVGTFLHTGLKLPYFTFAGSDAHLAPRPVPLTMLAAMVLTAALCVLTGSVPSLLYDLLPYPVTWRPYTTRHVLESLELLAGTAVAFAMLARHLGGERTVTLDTDRLYRGAGRWVGGRLAPCLAALASGLEAQLERVVSQPFALDGRRLLPPVGYVLLAALIALGLGLAGLSWGRSE